MKNNNNVIYVLIFVLLSILFPFSIIIEFASKIIKIFQIFSFIIILFLYLKNGSFNKNLFLIFLFLLLIFLSNIINNTPFQISAYYTFRLLSILLLYLYGFKLNSKRMIKVNKYFFILMCLLNFMSIIIYPNGMYVNVNGYTENWLLGFKNSHIEYLLMCILFCFLDNSKEFSLFNLIIIGMAFVSTIIVNNSTGILSLSVLVLLLLLQKISKIEFLLNIRTYFIIYISLFFEIVIFKIQNFFKYIIVTLLKKDLTFTGRIYVWNAAINKIKNNLFIGYGNNSFMIKSQAIGINNSNYVMGTHNTILDIIYKAGLFGLLIYLVIMVGALKKIWKYREYQIVKLLSIIIFCFFIMMIVEAYSFDMTFIILAICYSIKYILCLEVKNENKEFI